MAQLAIGIVGLPNVGKSSLLNRLARQWVSIVAPTPGVTRDRVSALIEIDAPHESPPGTPAKIAEVVDTGGYGAYTAGRSRYDDEVLLDDGSSDEELAFVIEFQLHF